MGLSKCCRARWIVVVTSSLPRGGFLGKGKRGRRGLQTPLRSLLFGGPRNSSSVCTSSKTGIRRPLAVAGCSFSGLPEVGSN